MGKIKTFHHEVHEEHEVTHAYLRLVQAKESGFFDFPFISLCIFVVLCALCGEALNLCLYKEIALREILLCIDCQTGI